MSKINIVPIFVPDYGCPLRCVFCNQKRITGVSTDISSDIVTNTILEYLSYFKRKDNVEVAFYGGSFTAIDFDIQNELLKAAYNFKEKGLVKSIRLSTRPDCINRKILDNLINFGVDTIELGVQSLDEEVLRLTNRGHNTKCVFDSSNLIKKYGFKLGLQQMVGLPGENFQKSYKTAKTFVELGADCVRIYPTLVIKDTALERSYKRGDYVPLDLEKSVSIVSDLIHLYYVNNIEVIRVGLQPTKNINFDGDVLAGPFHPAYRQLVEANYVFNALSNYLKHNKPTDEVNIFGSGRNISNIAGQRGINKNRLLKAFKLKKINLRQGPFDNYRIKINEEEIDLRDFYIMENLWS